MLFCCWRFYISSFFFCPRYVSGTVQHLVLDAVQECRDAACARGLVRGAGDEGFCKLLLARGALLGELRHKRARQTGEEPQAQYQAVPLRHRVAVQLYVAVLRQRQHEPRQRRLPRTVLRRSRQALLLAARLLLRQHRHAAVLRPVLARQREQHRPGDVVDNHVELRPRLRQHAAREKLAQPPVGRLRHVHERDVRRHRVVPRPHVGPHERVHLAAAEQQLLTAHDRLKVPPVRRPHPRAHRGRPHVVHRLQRLAHLRLALQQHPRLHRRAPPRVRRRPDGGRRLVEGSARHRLRRRSPVDRRRRRRRRRRLVDGARRGRRGAHLPVVADELRHLRDADVPRVPHAPRPLPALLRHPLHEARPRPVRLAGIPQAQRLLRRRLALLRPRSRRRRRRRVLRAQDLLRHELPVEQALPPAVLEHAREALGRVAPPRLPKGAPRAAVQLPEGVGEAGVCREQVFEAHGESKPRRQTLGRPRLAFVHVREGSQRPPRTRLQAAAAAAHVQSRRALRPEPVLHRTVAGKPRRQHQRLESVGGARWSHGRVWKGGGGEREREREGGKGCRRGRETGAAGPLAPFYVPLSLTLSVVFLFPPSSLLFSANEVQIL
eukprot:Rhum_TRINITY_DN18948_c0_g1::Rhum_TRINITY_DN18948_c0_g1_i1::g.168876::m.168876